MKKAIILTYAAIKEQEKSLLKETKIFKLALNQHAEELNPDKRIITDYILPIICKNFPQTVISVREKFRFPTDRVEYFDREFKGSTIISAIEYLIEKSYDEILIIGDNTVNSNEFQKEVNFNIEKILLNKDKKLQIYQYKNGNFNLPVKNIGEFLMQFN